VVIEERWYIWRVYHLKTLFFAWGHHVRFKIMEPISNPDFDYSLNFPGSRFDPRTRDWSLMFNFQFDLSLLVCFI
jgi:hypothetical protein